MSEWLANPAGLWAASLVVPLLLLYLLRHKPVRRKVASTALWAGVVDAQVSTSPFQRLRRSVSLILMLLAFAALLLALAGLRLPHGGSRGAPLTIVLDATAAMLAEEGSATRIELARALATETIAAAGSTDVAVIAWDGTMRAVAPEGSSPAAARAALASIQPSHTGYDAAALARALEQLPRDDRHTVWISSRGEGVPERVAFLRVGTSLPNAGIVAAGMSEPAPATFEVYFTLLLTGSEAPRAMPFVLERISDDGLELVDARDVRLEPGIRTTLSFTVAPGTYRGTLRSHDALELDNSAWVRCVPLPVLPVFADADVPASVRRALESIEQGMGGIRLADDSPQAARVIADAQDAGTLPRLPAVFIGPAAFPPGVAFGPEQDTSATTARPAPGFLWRGAGTPEIVVPRAAPVLADGIQRPVLETDAGAAIALVERANGLQDLVFGFTPNEAGGSFANEPAFIVFWANWLEHVRGMLDPLPRGAMKTGDMLRVPALSGRQAFELSAPQGDSLRVTPSQALILERAGPYRAALPTEAPVFGASLLDANAGNLSVSEGGSKEDVLTRLRRAASTEEARAFDLAPWLALLALTLLFTEWLLFRRRFPHREDPSVPASRRQHKRQAPS
jgi:hypothetical protein